MKNYKGYYIDHVVFNSEAEIDVFIKTQAIERYKMLCTMFANKPSMELNAIMCEQADKLHNAFGMECEAIEVIEIEAIKAA